MINVINDLERKFSALSPEGDEFLDAEFANYNENKIKINSARNSSNNSKKRK